MANWLYDGVAFIVIVTLILLVIVIEARFHGPY